MKGERRFGEHFLRMRVFLSIIHLAAPPILAFTGMLAVNTGVGPVKTVSTPVRGNSVLVEKLKHELLKVNGELLKLKHELFIHPLLITSFNSSQFR